MTYCFGLSRRRYLDVGQVRHEPGRGRKWNNMKKVTSEHAELVRYLNTETMLNLRFTDMKEEKGVINEPTIMGRRRKIKAEDGVGTNSEFAIVGGRESQ